MLQQAKITAFVATVDPVRARQFYEGILGLEVVADDDFALVLDANGTTLRVQKVANFTPLPFTALGWEVADIVGAVDALVQRGVRFEVFPGMEQDERGIWRAPGGARVAWFKDPSGNTLSLAQK